MDSENCPDLGGRPEEAADSEMAGLVPEDGQNVDASRSAEDRGDFLPASVDFDGDGVLAVGGSVVGRSKFSEPYFLKRVLKEELGCDGGGHRVLVIAVHAVMQESGFVAVDPVTGMPADRFHLADQWPSTAFAMSYSLPELVARSDGLNMPESVLLKFQRRGHFIRVHGFLAKAKLALRRVCLDERRLAPTMDLMWAKGDDNDPEADGDSSSPSSYPVKGVLEFWKTVKDGLALPLLIELTERVGLPLPSCFMCLSPELKLKIFELLPVIDLARVGCVCSELRHLTSNNDLWKQKHAEEFGERTESRGMINWKQSFACLRRWRVVGRSYSFLHR